MSTFHSSCMRSVWRTSFTLVELLTVVMIISILASTVLFALFKATQEAKIARTKAQVQRLNQLLLTRWESYRARPVRLPPFPPNTMAQAAARMKLDALRELMRLEMPERLTDVVNPSVYAPSGRTLTTGLAFPALARHYFQVAYPTGTTTTWSQAYQDAECLYMIIASIRENGTTGLDFLQTGEIGDTDGDAMPEILDAWGNPIRFLRWAPGFVCCPGADGQWGRAGVDDDSNGVTDDFSERLWEGSDDLPGLTTLMSGDPITSPDPFDPLRVYPATFALYPLIYSAGPDGKYDIATDIADPNNPTVRLDYTRTIPPNNPYYVPSLPMPPFPMGTPMEIDGDGVLSYTDNITNHFFEVK